MAKVEIDYRAGILAELQAIRDSLNTILELLQEERELKAGGAPRRRGVSGGAPAVSAEEVLAKLSEVDPETKAFVSEIKPLPSGDAFVKFKKLTSEEYKQLLTAFKNAYGDRAYYSRKYHGFIVKRA